MAGGRSGYGPGAWDPVTAATGSGNLEIELEKKSGTFGEYSLARTALLTFLCLVSYFMFLIEASNKLAWVK